MQLNRPLLKNTRSTDSRRGSSMGWSFMSAVLSVSLLRVAFSQPHVSVKCLFETEIGREEGGTSHPAAHIENSWKRQDFEKGQRDDNLNNVITDLDSNYHLANSLANGEDSPYFWRSNAFRLKFHRLEARDHNGRKISELSDSERVDAMKKDRTTLRYQLESLKEAMTAVNIPDISQNAYQLMDLQLKQLLEILIKLMNIKKRQKIGDQSPFLKLNPELKWEVLIHHAKNTFAELEKLLLYPLIKDTDSKRYISHLLKVQVFRMLNFFVKYNLIGEHFLKDWIQKKEVLESITEHIADSYNEYKLFYVGLQEVIHKSKSMEHLSIIQTLLKESDWKYIEFKCFKNKQDFLQTYWHHIIDQRLLQIEKQFSKAMFEGGPKYEVEEKKKCVEALIEYFHESPCDSSRKQGYYTYGLMQGMMYLIMRYHTDLFEHLLEEKNLAKIISLKLLATDSAMKWLKGARDLGFMAYDGFWITQTDSKESSHLIRLDKVKGLNFKNFLDQKLLGAHFDSFVSNSFMEGCNKFQSLLSYQDKLSRDHIFKLNVNYPYHPSAHRFGTNFDLRSLKTTRSLKVAEENKRKMVSEIFLSDLWNWVENLKYLLEEFRKNQHMFTEIINMISSINQAGGISDQMNIWISKSPVLQTIYHMIRKYLQDSQEIWYRIKENMKFVNQHILYSSKCSIPQGSKEDKEDLQMTSNDKSDKDHPMRNRIVGIEIPHFDFIRGTPFI